MRYLVLDVATAPIADAERYLDGSVKAPKNYGEDAAAKYVIEKQAERLEAAGLDMDLARLTGLAWMNEQQYVSIGTPKTEDAEASTLRTLAEHLAVNVSIITYGGLNFDLPLVQRRARYLGVPFPKLNTDRYKSPHVDLCELLSDRNPQRRRPLGFYVRRLGWQDLVKPLSGAEEARVPETGRWDELAASLRHDVTATHRLAVWLGVIPKPDPEYRFRSEEAQLSEQGKW